MAEVPLDVSRSAVFGADGKARIELGPSVYGHTWKVARMVVTTTSDANTDVRVYLNAVLDSRMVGGSYNGNRDINETDQTLQTLDKLIAVWEDGTPGATANLQLQGRVQTKGR